MTWGKMDDKFHRNRKVRELRKKGRAGREALGVWCFWWSWCLDDPELSGVVPACELAAGEAASAALLVEAGLWDEVEDGYAFHDFHEYNPTRDQVDAKRRADRERIAGKREASRANVASDAAATNPRVASPGRVPSRPVPTQPDQKSPPIPPAGGGSVELPDADPEAFRAPPAGGVYLAEVRDAWGEAYQAADAGTPPRLAPTLMASAVAFARDVAKTHGKPLREAARAIAEAAIAAGGEPAFHLTRLDPYAAPRSPAQREPQGLGEQIAAAEAELQAAAARKAPTPELSEIAGRLKALKTRRDEREERSRYARR